MNERAAFKHTVSVRERIINDTESTETLLQMVQVAHAVLVEDVKYRMYRSIMTEIVLKHQGLRDNGNNVIWQECLSCGVVGDDDYDDSDSKYEERSSHSKKDKAISRIVNKYSIELLRFLAVKVLLESIPTGEGLDHQRMPSTTDLNKYPLNEDRIVPSVSLRDGWRALLLLPKLYSDICTVMGCEGGLDFNTDDLVLDYQRDERVNSAIVKEARKHYRYTLITYEKLYLIIPDENIWSRLKDDDEEDKDTALYDEFNDLLQGVSSYFKGKIDGRERPIPATIRFAKDEF
eukprot:scaffold4589_cov266-Chaetoceros_neogracile.AAC.2